MIGKYLVIGAVLAGLLAFFMPFITFNVPAGGETKEVTFSAMKMMSGVDALQDAIAEEGGGAISESDKKAAEDVFTALTAVLLIPFIPTAFFLLITLIGIKRFGRGSGVFALLVGLVGMGGWAILNAVGEEAGDKASFGLGLTLIMVGALLGIIGGIAGIAKPQPKTT